MSNSTIIKISFMAKDLEPNELKKVISLLKKLQSTGSEVQRETTGQEALSNPLDSLFYKEVITYIYRLNGYKYPKDMLILKVRDANTFNQVLYAREKLDDYASEWLGDLKRNDKIRVYKLFAEVVGRYVMDRTQQVLSLAIMIRYTDDFPAILDKAFPGYIRAGLLPVVLTKDKGV